MPDAPLRALLVEDDSVLRETLAYNLGCEGFAPIALANGVEAAQMIDATPDDAPSFDLAILDMNLPGVDGVSLCRRIRRHAALAATPILALSARDSERHRVETLDAGADDYVIKPHYPRELIARLRALLRRARPSAPPMRVDPRTRRVFVGAAQVALTPGEFTLFARLVRHPGQVLTREAALEALGGSDNVSARAVDVHIARLRRRLRDAGQDGLIRTIRNIGYAIAPPA